MGIFYFMNDSLFKHYKCMLSNLSDCLNRYLDCYMGWSAALELICRYICQYLDEHFGIYYIYLGRSTENFVIDDRLELEVPR